MPNYMIWSMHGEVGVNVPHENNGDMAIPDISLHEAITNKEPGVNTEPMATDNDMFRNTLADVIEDDDDIS
jgi:hypothetical protein